MNDLIRLYAQIALLRRGPQDLPASSFLLVVTIAAYFIVNFAVSVVMPPFHGVWPEHLCVDVVFTFLWYAALLRIVRRPERFVQTGSAVFGFQTVLSPLLVASVWLTQRFPKDSSWSVAVTLLSLVLVVWIIAANAQVVKAALEWSLPSSVALVIAQTIAGNLLAATLFPLPGG